uniref:Uncharacterized protein n=1 Tax=Megaselia scalaris TaxID=36166 RepID=T1GAH3_MEGSC
MHSLKNFSNRRRTSYVSYLIGVGGMWCGELGLCCPKFSFALLRTVFLAPLSLVRSCRLCFPMVPM